MIEKRFKIGDLVLTRHSEHGRIVKQWTDQGTFRGFWLEIEFYFEGKLRKTREPHLIEELEFINET